MKHYIPHRDAAAFELRRTAYLIDETGRGEYLADEDGSYAIDDRIGGARVSGIVYSIYALYDDESGAPSRHITDEATPAAIRAYAARIGRGRPYRDPHPRRTRRRDRRDARPQSVGEMGERCPLRAGR